MMKTNFDTYLEEIDSDIAKLKKESKEWDRQFAELNTLHEKGRTKEKEGHIEEAIKTYKDAIQYAQSSTKMNNIVHFIRSIDRLVILLSKTKDYTQLSEVLKTNIKLYPKYSTDWKKRLEKIDSKK